MRRECPELQSKAPSDGNFQICVYGPSNLAGLVQYLHVAVPDLCKLTAQSIVSAGFRELCSDVVRDFRDGTPRAPDDDWPAILRALDRVQVGGKLTPAAGSDDPILRDVGERDAARLAI